MLHQRPHAAAVGRLGAVVAGGHEQEEAHHDLVLLELLAVDLGVDEDAWSGRRSGVSRRAAISSEQRRKISGISLAMMLCDPLRGEIGITGRRATMFISSAQIGVVLLGDAHEAPDHAGDDGLGDVGHQIAALASLEPVEHVARRSRGWRPRGRRSACGVKPAWKSILSRSCLGGSMPMNIARISSSGNTSVTAVTPPSSEEYVASRG